MRSSTRAELVELHARLGTTFVYVTHDQGEAMSMGSRVAVLDRGALQQVGPPQVVYDRPESVFVAQFIGIPPMNVLPGLVVDEGGRRRLRVPGGHLDLQPTAAAAITGGEVRVGIRPEHLHLGGPEGLRATLGVVESLGHERHLRCVLEDGPEVIVRTGNVRDGPREGDPLCLVASPADLHLFDSRSGRRLEAR